MLLSAIFPAKQAEEGGKKMKVLVTEKRLEKCAFSLSAPLESQFEVNEVR